MDEYTPDCWVILEFKGKTDSKYDIKKVFAGWYGGFTGGDSWKLSSGITEVKEFDDRYEFENYSGSIYICYKGVQRMSGLMSSVLDRWEKQTEQGEYTIKVDETYGKENLHR